MSLMAVINGVFGAVQAAKAVGDVIYRLEKKVLPSAGTGSPPRGLVPCCGNPNPITQQILLTHKVRLKGALTQLKHQLSASDAVDHHEAFKIDPLIDVLQSITRMSQDKVNDESVEHDQSAHERLHGHVSVVSELFEHLKGKAEDGSDRHAPLSKILDLLIQAVDGEQTHSKLLDLVQAHHADLDDFKGLFQDLLTSSEPAVAALSAGNSEGGAEGAAEALALNNLFNVNALDTLDEDALLGFLKELQAHQNDENAENIEDELFGKLMRSAQEAFVSRHTGNDASGDAGAALRALLGEESGLLIEAAREVIDEVIEDDVVPTENRNVFERVVDAVGNIFEPDPSDDEHAPSDLAVHADSDAALAHDIQDLIPSLSKAFQRAPVRHVGLVILSALATAPGVQPYWASLLSMITASSQTPMLPI